MKLYRNMCLPLLLILMLGLTFGMHASAEPPDFVLYADSDCGCSDSGAGTSESGSTGRSTSNEASQSEDANDVQTDEQVEPVPAANSVNLIWLNLLTACVIAATVIMLVRYKKAEQDARKSADAQVESDPTSENRNSYNARKKREKTN